MLLKEQPNVRSESVQEEETGDEQADKIRYFLNKHLKANQSSIRY
jgi:hypothetical protein